ncbi:MAG: TIM barrel protein [Succinatimonas sp.]|nr:TIM barrel protein [Succinatimonas sp.]
MKYGLRGHDLGRRTPEDVALFKDLGYDCVQLVFHKLILGIESFDDCIGKDITDTILKNCQERHLEIASVGCYQDLANPEAESYNLNIYRKYAKLACAINAHYLGTESAFVAITNEEIAKRRKQLLKIAPKICAIAQEEGVTLLLEPVRLQPLHCPELCLEILHSVPKNTLKFIFDPTNLVLNTEIETQAKLWDLWFENQELCDHIAMIHFKDFSFDEKGNRIMSRLNHGNIHWHNLKNKFKRLTNIEYAIREAQSTPYIQEELTFMKQFF